jgi:transcriptional regulator with XRE-family HTH domain
MSKFSEKIGSRIREIRKKVGLTREDLADKANLHYTYIGAAERGETNLSLKSLFKFAEALDVPIDYLVKTSEEEKILSEKELEIREIVSLIKEKDIDEVKHIKEIVKLIVGSSKPSKGKRKDKKEHKDVTYHPPSSKNYKLKNSKS